MVALGRPQNKHSFLFVVFGARLVFSRLNFWLGTGLSVAPAASSACKTRTHLFPDLMLSIQKCISTMAVILTTPTMTVVQQLPPSGGGGLERRSPIQRKQHKSLAYLKIGTCIGGICLILQLVLLNVLNHSQTSVGLPLTDPVFLVGLPRSGSLEIHNYFQCHGKSSVHYCCDGSTNNNRTSFPCLEGKTCGKCVLKQMQQQQPFVDACSPNTQLWSQYDVETEDGWFLPQHFALGLLHKTYPNATWILNRRSSPQAWAQSVLHWNSMTRRLFNSYKLNFYPHPAQTLPDPSTKVTSKEIEIDMAKGLTERVYNRTEYLRKQTLLQQIYENHTATIYEWVEQFPSHRFIEIIVDADVDDSHKPQAILDEVFGYQSAGKCQWSFDPPDDDWKDFSFSL